MQCIQETSMKNRNKMNKILIICGPTATGKTALALQLGQEFNGELLSADSRQIYIGMDIGTGKDLPEDAVFSTIDPHMPVKDITVHYGYYTIAGVPLWLLDLIHPDQPFSVAHFHELAMKTIQVIQKKGKLPIIVGGTGLFIASILQPPQTIHIPPDIQARSKLEQLSRDQLAEILRIKDLTRFNRMNHSDQNNSRRLIRAIEITDYKKLHKEENDPQKGNFDALLIGLMSNRSQIYDRIDKRVDERIQAGIQNEIEMLLEKGYSWQMQSLQTLGYREWEPWFAQKQTKELVIQQWKYDEHAYARRQMTWFQKRKDIRWYDNSNRDIIPLLQKDITTWIKSNATKS